MDASPPAIVVVLAREKEAGDRWSRVVAGTSVVVRRSFPRALGAAPDVIVTDLAEIGSRGAGDPAVVRIGVDGQATSACRPIAPRGN